MVIGVDLKLQGLEVETTGVMCILYTFIAHKASFKTAVCVGHLAIENGPPVKPCQRQVNGLKLLNRYNPDHFSKVKKVLNPRPQRTQTDKAERAGVKNVFIPPPAHGDGFNVIEIRNGYRPSVLATSSL